MTAVRVALLVLMMLGSMFAAVGLLDSLTQFGIGTAVAAAALVGYGLCDFLKER